MLSKLSVYLYSLLFLALTSCAGNNFDEANIPPEQLSAEMSYRRVADHGGMEAVLEENQSFTDWQFHIASKNKTSVLSSPEVRTFNLKDRSGIAYSVSSTSTPASILDLMDTGYGYASGKVVSVERDLAAGEIKAVLALSNWRERKF